MKVLFLILIFTMGLWAQSDLNKFEVVGIKNSVGFLVNKDRTLSNQKAEFTLLLAAIVQQEGTILSFDPTNFIEFSIIANCKDYTYRVISEEGIVAGEKYSKPKLNIFLKAENDINKTVFNYVCKTKELNTDD